MLGHLLQISQVSGIGNSSASVFYDEMHNLAETSEKARRND